MIGERICVKTGLFGPCAAGTEARHCSTPLRDVLALLHFCGFRYAPSNGLFSNTPFCPEGAGGDAETAAINPAQWRLHHSLQASHWNHIPPARCACLASKFCKRINKLVVHLQTVSLSSKTGPAHPK